MNSPLAQDFNSFSQYDSIFEDSSLTTVGIPKRMADAIHSKKEHYSTEYPRAGHMYRSKTPVLLRYTYHRPAIDIEIPAPTRLRGWGSPTSPFGLDTDREEGKESSSVYTDFIWFIRSIPYGECRVIISQPDSELFIYIYHKNPSSGATGSQYAVIAWDPATKKAIDFGFSEMTTRSVDLGEVGKEHKDKGGNTAGKIQQYVQSRLNKADGKPFGTKKWAYSNEKPVLAYTLPIPVDKSREPRSTRLERKEASRVSSFDFIRVVADRLSRMIDKMKPEVQQKLSDTARGNYNMSTTFPEVEALAQKMEVNAGAVQSMLYKSFRDFRSEIFEEGRDRQKGALSAYSETAGFELERENSEIAKYGGSYQMKYNVQKMYFSPDEEQIDPERGNREGQAEKYKSLLPVAGDYASIRSLINRHTLDGTVSKFIAFLVTGKIKFADVSLGSLLGVSSAEFKNPYKEYDDEDEEANFLR